MTAITTTIKSWVPNPVKRKVKSALQRAGVIATPKPRKKAVRPAQPAAGKKAAAPGPASLRTAPVQTAEHKAAQAGGFPGLASGAFASWRPAEWARRREWALRWSEAGESLARRRPADESTGEGKGDAAASGTMAPPPGSPPEILADYARFRQLGRLLASPAPRFEGHYNFIDAAGFRAFIQDKTVALVANSDALLGQGRGAEIDAHDVVIRFNSFAIIPEDTGAKTDVHAAIHLHPFNLGVFVPVRILFSGSQKLWQQSVAEKIDPAAQRWLGDASLHWPMRSKALIGDDGAKIPTTGHNMIRLLHFYGVARAVNLYGFDGYASGILRVPEAMALPIAAAHGYDVEMQWLADHAEVVDPLLKRLRPN